MKNILATSILLTLFALTQGCGHMGGHKHNHGSEACACEKSNATCKCEGHSKDAKKDEKKSESCTECAGKKS